MVLLYKLTTTTMTPPPPTTTTTITLLGGKPIPPHVPILKLKDLETDKGKMV